MAKKAPSILANAFNPYGPDGHVQTWAEIEKRIIEKAITHYKGKMVDVAHHLKIGRSTLYRKIAEYEIKAIPQPAGANPSASPNQPIPIEIPRVRTL